MKKSEILIGLGIALLVAVVLSPIASPWPDGLESVADQKGFSSKIEEKPVVPAIMPDYKMPGIRSGKWSTAVSGFAGTLLLYFGGYGLAKLLQAKKASSPSEPKQI